MTDAGRGFALWLNRKRKIKKIRFSSIGKLLIMNPCFALDYFYNIK